MNLVLFEAHELGADRILRLPAKRGEYLREIQGVEPGFLLRVGQIDGPAGQATVLAVDKSEVVLEVGPLAPCDATMDISIVLGLPRPQTLKKVLETAATYGVRRLILTAAHRAQKSYFSSKVLQPERLRAHLLLGLEQGMGTALPEVVVCRAFSDLQLPPEMDFKLLATPSAESSLPQLGLQRSLLETSRVVLGVGPEGGWSEREERWFVEQGFSPFQMGKRVLRVETAVCSLLAQLFLLQQLACE